MCFVYCVGCGSIFPCCPSHFHMPPPLFPHALSTLPPSPLHASRVHKHKATMGVRKWHLHATPPCCCMFPTLCAPLLLVRHLPQPPPRVPSPPPPPSPPSPPPSLPPSSLPLP